MQQLIVHIPDARVSFFLELARNLGIEVEGDARPSILSAAEIELVEDERRKIKEDPDYLLDWEKVRNTLNPEQ